MCNIDTQDRQWTINGPQIESVLSESDSESDTDNGLEQWGNGSANMEDELEENYEPQIVEGYEELDFESWGPFDNAEPAFSPVAESQCTKPSHLPWHSFEYRTPPKIDAAKDALKDL